MPPEAAETHGKQRASRREAIFVIETRIGRFNKAAARKIH
jgi:hypothetical protein